MKECILEVKVIPNVAKNTVIGFEGNALKIRLHATPEKGKANEELIAFLSNLGLKKSAIILVKGQTSRKKILKIFGMSLDEIQDIISQNR